MANGQQHQGRRSSAVRSAGEFFQISYSTRLRREKYLNHDDSQIEKGTKFLNDRWLALEQSTQHQHLQIDQMMKMLRLINTEKSKMLSKLTSSIRGGHKASSQLEEKEAPSDDKSRNSHLRFSDDSKATKRCSSLEESLNELHGASNGRDFRVRDDKSDCLSRASLKRKKSVRLWQAKNNDDDPLNKWHRCLSSEERDAMTTAFKFVDVDGSGGLDSAEFRSFMEILRLDISAKEANAIMSHVDTDRNGIIDLDEFMAMMGMIKVGAARNWSHIGAAMEKGMRELLGFAKSTFRADGDDDFSPPSAKPTSPTTPKDADLDTVPCAAVARRGKGAASNGITVVSRTELGRPDPQSGQVTKSLAMRCRSADSRLGPRLPSSLQASGWAESPSSPGGEPQRSRPVSKHQRPYSQASSAAPSDGGVHMPRFERVLVPRRSLLPGTEVPSPRVQLRWRAEARVPSRPSSRMSGSSAMTRPSTGLPGGSVRAACF